MYFVDRTKIEERLCYIEKLHLYLIDVKATPQALSETLAYERALHMTIEAILDIGNQMIDGFIMRDPGSYEDIIAILLDEQVVVEQEATSLLTLVSLRKKLVTDYTQIDAAELWKVYQQAQEALASFPERIRHYLQQHLGPVSAFLPS